MSISRRTFVKGIMDLDSDERTIPDGVFRRAETIDIIHSEGSDVGSVRNMLSNKKLTSLSLGPNPKENGIYCCEFEKKIYWLVKSDTGCYIIEYDRGSQTSTFILKDTRPEASRVLKFREGYLATGIAKIINEDKNKNLILLTDNNLPPLCINPERAKTYGENGFELEDILLIKKPPRFAPNAALINTGSLENNLEERFLSFTYRYKYLDGEFSAFSSYTNCAFSPKAFDLDFETFENLGMINSFNAVRLSFDTGDKRVTDIQLGVKESNSNNLYVIETFNKEKEGWGHNLIKTFTFSNDKIYTALPSKELGRRFDNVPNLAQSLTLINNIPVFGDYEEGFNLIDKNGNKVNLNYLLSLLHQDPVGINVPKSLSNGDSINDIVTFDFSDIELKNKTRLSFFIKLTDVTYGVANYEQTLDFILNRDYSDALELASDPDFITFINTALTNNFLANYETTPPANSSSGGNTSFTIVAVTPSSISIKTLNLTYVIDDTPAIPDDPENVHNEISYFGFDGTSHLSYFNSISSATAKTNRSYEIGVVYLEPFSRSSTVLTQGNNTIYIPQTFSTSKNTIKIAINSLPPVAADRYKIVVKTPKLSYHTVYASIFYKDGIFRWVKLDGESKDKVKEGDILIVKKDINGPIGEIIKVKVLEVKPQEENFITGNNDEDGNEIIEPAGVYMKIKPNGFNIDYSQNEFISYEANGQAVNNRPFTRLEGLSRMNSEGDIVDVEIPQGSTISLKFVSDGRGRGRKTFEKTYVVQTNYANFKDWFDENITLPLSIQENNIEKYTNVFVVRGTPVGENGYVPDPNGYLFLMTEGITPGNGQSRHGFLSSSLNIRLVDGFFIFETEPKQADLDVYYETEQTFEIIDGFHKGNLQDQTSTLPAEIELDFSNCFSMGNGAEEYVIKSAFNKNALNIDTRPSATSIAEFSAVRKIADLTHGEPYNESSNVNGINEFNLSTGNFKSLDLQHGSVQKLLTRDGDIVVLQEAKASKVMFQKEILYNSDGSSNVVSTDKILGSQVTYLGENGIGRNPESCAVNDYQIFYTNSRRGVVQRLSMDGVTDIVNYMENHFRDLFISSPNSKKIGGFDPYRKQYVLAVDNEPQRLLLTNCNTSISKSDQSEAFSYNLKLNNLGGDIVLNYNISQGNATITALFNGNIYVASNVSGIGNLTFERTSLIQNIVEVTITAIGGPISYEIHNICPFGTELKIVNIVLNDELDLEKNIINRYRWNSSPYYQSDDLFNNIPVSRFEAETGLEGVGKFPINDSIVNIQSLKTALTSGRFEPENCNKIGYLISDTQYDENDIDTIINNATFLTLEESGEEGFDKIFSGNFLFSRSNVEQILYLIWDYTSRNPILTDDFASASIGGSVDIDVLANDEVNTSATVSISSQPQHGTAVVNPDKTITYTHDGSDNFEDTLVYQVTLNGCSSTAIITIGIGVPCTGGIDANGGTGIYEAVINVGTGTGYTGIEFNAQGVPDRFQIYYDDVLVGDSKYVGDSLAGSPPGYAGLLGPKTLNVFSYDGSVFVNTGTTRDIDVVQSDIANGTTESTNGNGILYFNKTAATPTTIKVVVTGPVGGTAWNIWGICPQSEIPEMEHNI